MKGTKVICLRCAWLILSLILAGRTLTQSASAQTAEKVPLPEYV